MINMKSLLEINEYIEKHKKEVNGKYRLKYHMMPPIGWMNDPNGLLYSGGRYHLFYQYNPYHTQPGTMLWGHFTSADLIHYTDEPVALAPVEEHTSIFSGGAIEIDHTIYAVYTIHYEYEGVKKEGIYLSKSLDTIHFTEPVCIFDNEELPENISRIDFRDPYPVKRKDKYYVLVGGKNTDKNQGVIVVLEGDSLERLKYSFTIGPFYELGDMGECPSLVQIDGRDVLIASGCHVPSRGNDFKNVNSSVFIVGELDFIHKKMKVDFIKEIDKGDTFYAPQFINQSPEPILIGWLEMWGKPYPTHNLGHGWTGAFSIPRKISIHDGDIYQSPVDLASLYQECAFGYPQCLDIACNIYPQGKITIAGENGCVRIALDEYVTLDTLDANNENGCIRRSNQRYSGCQLRILCDVSSIELFIDDGKEVISSRIYLDGAYSISADKNVQSLKIKKIGVD